MREKPIPGAAHLEGALHLTKRRLALVLLAVLLVAGMALAHGAVGEAAAQGGTEINWWVIAAGGGSSAAGDVAVNDTLGQAVAGPSQGETVFLSAGYWYGGAAAPPCSVHLWRMKLNWGYAVRPGYVKLVDLGMIVDESHVRARGATVSGFWTLPDGSQVPQQVTTDLQGRFKFRYKGPWLEPGEYRFDLTDVQYESCVYDPDANESDPWLTVTIPPPP